jgi:hypothetical protein
LGCDSLLQNVFIKNSDLKDYWTKAENPNVVLLFPPFEERNKNRFFKWLRLGRKPLLDRSEEAYQITSHLIDDWKKKESIRTSSSPLVLRFSADNDKAIDAAMMALNEQEKLKLVEGLTHYEQLKSYLIEQVNSQRKVLIVLDNLKPSAQNNDLLTTLRSVRHNQSRRKLTNNISILVSSQAEGVLVEDRHTQYDGRIFLFTEGK